MGDLEPLSDSFKADVLVSERGRPVPVVRVAFRLRPGVEEDIYGYIVDGA